ncbi:short-chain dehydrogenase/reductase SDR [Macrolepiota fuliginosa MF-IS2]|uniref:Short-chain dehydrogenase/reductase SDR n=1 Tax=Macrolepiota fuliginosa MF-IS2 TaxID=1400762 RepID=A0A9P6C1P7_9AGAR|nr:short-chain dehydrogenase/reductase SDR [Macrolepiota fuliginosa MF-IS2]
MTTIKHVVVVAGVGNGTGTGAAVARLFSREGYAVALLARDGDSLNKFADELNQAGGEAVPFPLPAYSAEAITSAWSLIKAKFPKPAYEIRVAVWNAGHAVFKKFLDITAEDIEQSTQVNIAASFSFSRQAILTFKENEIGAGNGKRGALIFTGATAALRGNVVTSAFAASKHANRALSQSLNKEFGKENIHVAHVVIDGVILTDRVRERFAKGPEWEQNEDARLNADSIANSYLYLVRQDRSAWTWELDLRPAHEKW